MSSTIAPGRPKLRTRSLREPKRASGPAPVKHFYSSKPALLPTLIAGIIYPARIVTGVPLDQVVFRTAARWTQKPDPISP